MITSFQGTSQTSTKLSSQRGHGCGEGRHEALSPDLPRQRHPRLRLPLLDRHLHDAPRTHWRLVFRYPPRRKRGAAGDIVLVVEMPEGVAESYEWVQDIGYREFLIPADVANQYGRPEVAVDERDWPEHQARRRGHGLPIDVPAAYLLHAENELQESEHEKGS